MITTIVYTHGYNASPTSFTWLTSQFPNFASQFFAYTIDESISSCVDRLFKDLDDIAGPVILLGHSLGGVISLACAQRLPNTITHVVTLNSPFGGIKYAGFASLFDSQSVFSDLRYYSPFLMHLRAAKSTVPHLAIVGTRGMPFLREPNDGVVTVVSQTALSNQMYERFSLNHYETLLAPDVALSIENFISDKI